MQVHPDLVSDFNYDLVCNNINRDILEKMLDKIPQERTAQLLRWRFGLDGEQPLTLKACGERINVSVGRARDIVERGLRQLRHPKVLVLIAPEYGIFHNPEARKEAASIFCY